MFKVMKRECPVFGDGPYVCEFLCDTASDVTTLPTSTSEGTGGKTAYDNQKCASGSIATVVDNGAESKRYMLNNQNIWCPNEIGTGSSYELPIATTEILGGVMVDGTSITADENGVISAVRGELPVASTDTLGGVMIDGTSITADEQGVISAVGGGGLTLLGRYANTHNAYTTIGTISYIPEGTILVFISTSVSTNFTNFYMGSGIVPSIIKGAVGNSWAYISGAIGSSGTFTQQALGIRNDGTNIDFFGNYNLGTYIDIYKWEV